MDWDNWSKSSFARAKKERKLVLLYLSTSWCHWCHTMDRVVYSDSGVVDFINENFVPIRVDAQRRPDINARYMSSGWPSTVVLNASGDVVLSGSFVDRAHMVVFLKQAISRAKKVKSSKNKLFKPSSIKPVNQVSLLKSVFDPVCGGFGFEPKFPHISVLEFLLWKSDDVSCREMLIKTLDSMSRGEIFDSVEGGFYRYATKTDWSFPHFEKLLEDNVRLLSIYSRAWTLFNRDDFLSVANKTLYFLMTKLHNSSGVFSASQSADESYCRMNLVDREASHHPAIDVSVFTDSNAWSALSFFALSDEHNVVALGVLDSLYKNVLRGGVSHLFGERLLLLRDHVVALLAYCRAFEVTNRLEHRNRALLVAKSLERFYDKKDGGFFDTLYDRSAVGLLKSRLKPLEENSLAAIALLSLSKISGDDKYVIMARKALESVSRLAADDPFAVYFAMAVELLEKTK